MRHLPHGPGREGRQEVSRHPARLSANEVAATLRMTRAELDELRGQGDAPLSIVDPAGDRLTRPADLNRWIEAHTVRPEPGNLVTADELAAARREAAK
jgi:hypothetical protein